jgi:putative peptidoglycan lipid II flippase
MSDIAVITPPPPPARPAPTAEGKSFLAHAKQIGALTLVSRILGLAREVVAGHYLGTGLVASAFTVAFTIPNLFRKLFGEGALSAAFIPLYAQAVKSESAGETTAIRPGSSQANDFAAASVNLLCLILLGLTIVGELLLGALLWFGRDMRPDRLLTLQLTAIMLPYVMLICGSAFLSGILQVHKRFGVPAAAPILLNVVHIIVVFIGARMLQLKATLPTAAAEPLQQRLAYWLAGFVLVAGVMQFAVMLPGLAAVGFRFKIILHFWTPMVRKMLRLTVPVMLGAGVLQISVLLDKGISVMLMKGTDAAGHAVTYFHFAGHLVRYPMEMGAPARLNLAQFLYQFPLGVFAIALATAIFPGLSADALDKDQQRFKSVLRQGIEATLLEGLPASIGLILVREPATRLLFRHGEISSNDATWIANSVLWYAGAIWAFGLLQILNRAFYAMHDTRTPLLMSAMNLAINLVVELPLVWTHLGESGMAVGTLVSFIIQAVLTLYLLDRRVGGLGLSRSVAPVCKMVLATAIMTAACLGLEHLRIYPHLPGPLAQYHRRLAWSLQLMELIGVGGLVYIVAAAAMGVGILEHVLPARMRRSRSIKPAA